MSASEQGSMRIAYLVSQYPASSHTFIRREIEGLRSRGFGIETFSVRRPSAAEQAAPLDHRATSETWYVLPLKITVLAAAHVRAVLVSPVRYVQTLVAALRHRVPGGRAVLWAIFHFIESIVLAAELKRRRIDHLHVHFANSGATVGMLAARHRGCSWSLTLHGISETDYPAGLLLPQKLASAEFAACVSWFGRAQAMRICRPEDWPKLFVSRCGLPLPAFVDRPEKRARTIICVGRLSAEKGHLGLLEAFAGLRTKGYDTRLVLVGDGPESGVVRSACVRLELDDAVEFRGRLDEAATLGAIAASDILVLPSFMEGLPIVLMEAMALGVPVIASHVAGIPELVEDGYTGLLFPPGNWDALMDGMQRLMDDDALRFRLARKARQTIEQSFAMPTVLVPLERAFSKLTTRQA